jgi:hypothetical protein
MGLQIEDGTGQGYRTGVTAENQLLTQAETHELQHHISMNEGQVYQAIGTHTLSGAGTKTILHIRNNDPSRFLVVSYMRVQFPGGDGTIDAATYFDCGFDASYTSGGTQVTPVNMNASSGNVASVVAYEDDPTVGGSFAEFDRYYPDKSMEVFNKHGSLILGFDDTVSWRLTTDQITGLAYARVTLMMLNRTNI